MKNNFVSVCLLSVLLLGTLFSACKNDDIPSESYYTLKKQTVAQYLAETENYSIFNDILQRDSKGINKFGFNIPSLLSAYGYYTVFAPTNKAIEIYMNDAFGVASLDELYEKIGTHSADSVVDLIANMHVISSGHNVTIYTTESFVSKIPDRNLNEKVIYITPQGDTYRINDMATIVAKDEELHNGVVHGIDSVIMPSNLRLADFFEKYPRYSLFGHLMDYVGLMNSDRIHTEPECDYVLDTRDYSEYKGAAASIEVPTSKKQFYTVFIEPNEVYAAALPDLAQARTVADSIEVVKAYAREWYEREFSDATQEEKDAALNEDWGEPENFLNRFVAYHIVNMKVDRADFTRYKVAVELGYDRLKEFYESLAPNQEIYMSSGKNGHPWEGTSDPNPDMIVLNPNPESKDLIFNEKKDWGRPVSYIAEVGTTTLNTENGFFHELKQILTYPRKDFKQIRFRHDFSSTMFPEIMNNDFRYKYMATGYIVMPQQPEVYCSNIHFLSDQTIQIQTSPNINAGVGYWNSFLGDEMMFSGAYDFVLRLPPVPAGTYEVRLGYVSASDRGCVQFYLGSDDGCDWESKDFSGLKAAGIPKDLTVAFLTQMGRAESEIADAGKDEETILELDKEWHQKGRMRGPNCSRGANGNDNRTLRDILAGHNPSRLVVGTIELKKDGPIYLRARSMATEVGLRLGADYVEVVPSAVYDNPFKQESRD